jgi:hypothetical protein
MKSVEPCGLWDQTYTPGVLYVTSNFLCYSDLVDERRFCFPFTVVVGISLESFQPFKESKSVVITVNGETVSSTNIFS